MTDRRALLIGVPGCENAPLEAIPDSVVTSDVTRMRDVLFDSGYVTTVLGVPLEVEAGETVIRQPASAGSIIGQIKEACRGVPAGGTVLVYFSGHGVQVDGKDYLVPADGRQLTGDDTLDPDTLVPLDPARYLDRCPARLVVFIIDACRDGGGGEFGGQALAATRAPVAARPANGVFALFAGCAPGEVCGYDDQGSFFTQTLADILDRRHPAQTVDAVFNHVRERMLRRARRSDGPSQKPQMSIALSDADRDVPTGLAICAGEQVFEAWQECVRESPLWLLCAGAPADRVERLRDGLAGLVEEYARQWRGAQESLVSQGGLADPWVDHDYPVRVTERVGQLLHIDADAPPTLSPAEVGLLVVAPFLREAVLAEGLSEAAMLSPTDFSRTHNPGPRSDLEITHSIHQHMCHRAEGLVARGRLDERNALAMWLVHRWVTGRQDLWDSARTTELCRRLAARLLDESADGTGLWTAELAGNLAGLVACLGTVPSAAAGDELAGCAVPGLRSAGLAGVLSLAGALAVDIRRLAPVVADHIGIRDALDLDELRTTVTLLRWEGVGGPAGRGLDLRTVCAHPAVHSALLEVAGLAEQSRAAAVRLASRPGVDAGLLTAFPTAVTAEGITPAGTGVRNERRYEKQLLRFRLSDDKIKELLMGRQLYGDPALALRELYQNALDACRYRQMRRRYLAARGEPVPEWRGRITFTQGVEDGQPFIECADNGVGMGADTLKNTFAQAGQRFVHGDAFRWEQARWQRIDPELRLIPNSQFGIGVFSYFMLADEISIRTRATNEYAEPVGDTLRIDISSSGSLFRIRRDHGVPSGGTSVRLLLTGEEKISVRRTLNELIWLPEFDVEIWEVGREPELWPAGELRHVGGGAPAVRVTERVWWVAGEGGLTADGIRTGETGYGYVVDLRDRQRPRFSVDRQTMRDWDRAWVAGELRNGLSRLVGWRGLTLRWLWSVTESKPEVAQQVYEYLVDQGIRIPVGGDAVEAEPVDLGRVGCVPSDRRLLGQVAGASLMPGWLELWRRAACSLAAPIGDLRASPVRVDGYPVPSPLDGHLLTQFGDLDIIEVGTFATLVGELDQPARQLYRRFLRLAITGLDVRPLRVVEQADLTSVPVHLIELVLVALHRSAELDPPVSAILVHTSVREGLSIGEVLNQARQWLPPDNATALLDPKGLADHVCTRADLTLLSQDLDGAAPWVPGRVSLRHLDQFAAKTGVPLTEARATFGRFAPLGYTMPDPELVAMPLTEVEKVALLSADSNGVLGRWRLLDAAARVGLSIRAVREGLRRLESLGQLSLPDLDELPDVVPTSGDRNFVMRRAPGRRDEWSSSARTIAGLITSHSGWSGVEELRDPALLLRLASPNRPISVPELLSFTDYCRLPVAECLVALKHNGVLTEEQPAVTELVATSPDLRPSWRQIDLLCVERGHEVRWRERWTPIGIIGYTLGVDDSVAVAIQGLDRYRPFGAPVPELPADALAALAEVRPDAVDLRLLPESDDDEPSSTVSMLHLVRESGRLGLTLPEAQQRLDRYVPLGLTFDYEPAAVPDGLVLWQDLILLSAHFDGYEPAVGPVVPAAHIDRCADLTGETPAWVRDRLRHYAPLFDLTVPTEENPGD